MPELSDWYKCVECGHVCKADISCGKDGDFMVQGTCPGCAPHGSTWASKVFTKGETFAHTLKATVKNHGPPAAVGGIASCVLMQEFLVLLSPATAEGSGVLSAMHDSGLGSAGVYGVLFGLFARAFVGHVTENLRYMFYADIAFTMFGWYMGTSAEGTWECIGIALIGTFLQNMAVLCLMQCLTVCYKGVVARELTDETQPYASLGSPSFKHKQGIVQPATHLGA